MEVPESRGGEGSVRRDFQLEPGGTVRGWLLRDGRGSPGLVHIFRRTDPETVTYKGSVRADQDGLFSFSDALDDGTYLLCGFAAAHPAGIYLNERQTFKIKSLPGEVPIRVEQGMGPQEVLVESSWGDCAVSGRVVDPSGRPIPGASLVFDLDAEGFQTYGEDRERKTSDTGEFSANGFHPAKLTLWVKASGFASRSATAILRAGETARLEIAMEKTRTFRARIEYADGKPDGKPRVSLQEKADGGWRSTRRGGEPGRGLEGGVYKEDDLPPGIYRIHGKFRDHAEADSPEADLREAETADVVLRADVGATVSGKISFEDPSLWSGKVSAVLQYQEGDWVEKPVWIEGDTYRIQGLNRGRVAWMRLDGESKSEGQKVKRFCSHPIPEFFIDKDDTKYDLRLVRVRKES